MAKKGWSGESRRHGLARKGVKTVIDDDKRLAVNNYVARGWHDKLRNVYANKEEWIAYAEMYGLHKKLGFDTPEEAWDENPHIKGGTDPGEYGLYKPKYRTSNKNKEISHKTYYKGFVIDRLFPSGYYQYYSDKEKRFLTFDTLEGAKAKIRKE